MKISRTGIELIKRWEGCRLRAYPDPATGGEPWTIGYGLTSAAGIVTVKPGLTITQAQADEYLVASLVKYEAAVQKAVTRSPTQNQFDAMVSLCFNIGPSGFAKSTVVRKFNGGDAAGAADAFLLWRKAGGRVIPGLEARRKDERALFLKPSLAQVPNPAPSKPHSVAAHDEPVTRHAAADVPKVEEESRSLWARFISWWRS